MSLREVDFLHEVRSPVLGWWLLAAGAAALASSLWIDQRWDAERAEADRAAQATVEARRARERQAAQVAPVTPADKQQRKAQAELARPWLAAMRVIETATTDPVYLLSLKFERSAGLVKLEAEAPGFGDALAYTRRLNQGRPLSSAVLNSHEEVTDAATGRNIVKFSVVASWSAQ